MKWFSLIVGLVFKLILAVTFMVTKGAEMMLQAINNVLQKSFER
jgi:hypothetical protein